LRLFWHLYAVNHWFDVYAETLFTLKRAGFTGPVTLCLIGNGGDAWQVRSLAGRVGLFVDELVRVPNQYEYPTLQRLWQYCQTADDPICYLHGKGVTSPWPAYVHWRWMMLSHIVLPWRERLADLDRYDAVGCCHQPDWPCFAGNWWWARADWIRRLPAPIVTADRFYYERWLLSETGCRIKSLVATGGDPYLDPFYTRYREADQPFLQSFCQ
jgi:hypothetical protein